MATLRIVVACIPPLPVNEDEGLRLIRIISLYFWNLLTIIWFHNESGSWIDWQALIGKNIFHWEALSTSLPYWDSFSKKGNKFSCWYRYKYYCIFHTTDSCCILLSSQFNFQIAITDSILHFPKIWTVYLPICALPFWLKIYAIIVLF